MSGAEEDGVVTEHKQQIKSPHHYVPLHKGDDARMVCHRPELHIAVHAAVVLYPADKVAARTCAEDIQHDEHHPHAKRGGHDEIFGA